MLRLFLDQYRAGARQAPHVHDELHLSLVLTGVIAEEVQGKPHLGTALSVVWKDPGVRHADAFGPGDTRIARLSIHNSGLSQLMDAGKHVPPFRWTHDPRAARPFLRLLARLPAVNSFQVTDDDVADLLAVLSARDVAQGTPPRWLTVVVERIADDPAAVTTRDLAHDAGVHPVYLARVLRRWYGANLRELRSAGKLRLAAARLGRDGGSNAAIAAAAGFSDEAHLSHTFRRLVGISPSAFRELARTSQG